MGRDTPRERADGEKGEIKKTRQKRRPAKEKVPLSWGGNDTEARRKEERMQNVEKLLATIIRGVFPWGRKRDQIVMRKTGKTSKTRKDKGEGKKTGAACQGRKKSANPLKGERKRNKVINLPMGEKSQRPSFDFREGKKNSWRSQALSYKRRRDEEGGSG